MTAFFHYLITDPIAGLVISTIGTPVSVLALLVGMREAARRGWM